MQGMTKFQQILQALVSAEESIVPLFIHNPASQKIAAVVIATESAVPGLISEIQGLVKPATPPTA